MKRARRDAAELLGEGEPAVLGVPDHIGGEHQAGDDHGEPGPGGGEALAAALGGQQPRQDAGGQEQGRVLGDAAQAGEQACRQPPLDPAAGPELGERPQGEDPEQTGRGVGGGEDAAHPDGGSGVVPDGGPQAGLGPGAQRSGDVGHQPGGEAGAQDRQQAHAQGIVAGQGQARARPPGDHRRVVVIAQVQVLGPEAVIGLVLGERDPAGGEEADDRHRQDQEAQAGAEAGLVGGHHTALEVVT